MDSDARLKRIERQLAKLVELAERKEPPRWLTIAGAVHHTALSERTIRSLIAKGDLNSRNPVRGRILLDRHELDGFIASSTHAHRKGRGHHLAALKIAANGNGER